MVGGRSGVWRSRERARNKLIISSERAQGWDRRSWAGLADGNNDGLFRTEAGELLTLAQLIDEGLVVQEGVKKHTRYRLHGVAL